MEKSTPNLAVHEGIWDARHVKALLRFARAPFALIQQNPWHTWIGQRGGLKAVYAYLAEYPFASAHRRMIEVVLQIPEAVADVYADALHMSRATFFNHLPAAIAAVAQALNQWQVQGASSMQREARSGFSLPSPLTSLIGVDQRLATLEALLARDDVRLLTLLGPGGSGKSRLAIALAQRSVSPACFVSLANVPSADAAPGAIAAALGVENGAPATLKRALDGGDFLLVLDNLEHILEAQRLAIELLQGCSALKIVVTSRVALHAYGEHEYVVPPLETASDQPAIRGASQPLSPAAELFVARAQTVRPGLRVAPENRAAIEEICRVVEGNPLAIELAAFQAKYYAPRTILERIAQEPIDFLGKGIKGMPAHQRGMGAALEWSYDLLALEAQELLIALASLPADFTVEDAERVRPGGGEVALTLVDHSLLQQEHCADGRVRFAMSELVRAYARGLGSRKWTAP